MSVLSRVRLRFAKQGDLRLVSHHDLMRCLERLVRRAGLPVAQSKGFNPRPKIAFALALALGIEGRREVVDIDLEEPLGADRVRELLASESPDGLEWFEAQDVPIGKAVQISSVRYELQVPADRREVAARSVEVLLASDRWPFVRRRPDRDIEADLRPFVLGAELDPEGTLQIHLKMTPSGSARPEEVLDALGLRDLLGSGGVLVRTDMDLAPPTESGPTPPAPPKPAPPSAAGEPPPTLIVAGGRAVDAENRP
ncbi:TIGR03936 family radical SAM-associated protein [Isosphaeraceae bacterium EP7]